MKAVAITGKRQYDISYEHASMACCGLGPSFGAMRRMQVDSYDSLLVMGLGPVGLGAVINGAYLGAKVIAADPNPYRRDLAKELGAVAAIDPAELDALLQLRALGGGRGVDKAVDCTAVPVAQQLAYEAVRRHGHLAFVGWGGGIETGNMIPGGKTLHGCWHWNLRHAPQMMQLIRDCGDLIDRQVTHSFPMAQVGEAWDLQSSGECGKILLYPWK